METIDLIRIARNRKGIYQSTMAKHLGVSLTTYKRYEKYDTVPDVITASKMADILSIELKDIVEDYKVHKTV